MGDKITGVAPTNEVKTLTDLQGKAAITDEQAEAKGKGIGFYPQFNTVQTQHGLLGDQYTGLFLVDFTGYFAYYPNFKGGINFSSYFDRKIPYFGLGKKDTTDEFSSKPTILWRAFLPASATIFAELMYGASNQSSVKLEAGLRDGDPRPSLPKFSASPIKYYGLNETQWSIGGTWNHFFNETWNTSFKAYFNPYGTDVNTDLVNAPEGSLLFNDIRSFDFMFGINANWAGHSFFIQPHVSPMWSDKQKVIWRTGVGASSKFQALEDFLYFGLHGSVYKNDDLISYNVMGDVDVKLSQSLSLDTFFGYGKNDSSVTLSRAAFGSPATIERGNEAYELGSRLNIMKGAAWILGSAVWSKNGPQPVPTTQDLFLGFGTDFCKWKDGICTFFK